jgi:hypothetical protein
MATKTWKISTSFICKNTDVNRLPIFMLIRQFKCDFMQKRLGKIHRLDQWIDTIDRVCTDGLIAIGQTKPL